MKKYEIDCFTFGELSESAKSAVIDRYRWDIMDENMSCCNYDYEATLKEFERITDSYARDWEVGYDGYRFRVGSNRYFYEDLDMEEVTGKLLFRWVYNEVLPYLWKGRFLGYKGKRPIYSKVSGSYGDCPLTGMCYDIGIIRPILKYYKDWVHYPADYSLRDLMEECYDSFFDAWHKDYEFQATDEAVEEHLYYNCEDDLYDEDGNLIIVPTNAVERQYEAS